MASNLLMLNFLNWNLSHFTINFGPWSDMLWNMAPTCSDRWAIFLLHAVAGNFWNRPSADFNWGHLYLIGISYRIHKSLERTRITRVLDRDTFQSTTAFKIFAMISFQNIVWMLDTSHAFQMTPRKSTNHSEWIWKISPFRPMRNVGFYNGPIRFLKKITAKRTSSKMVAVCSSPQMKIQLTFSDR